MLTRPSACIGIAFAAISPELTAQLQFEELGKRHLPIDADQSHAVATGDVDGDGDLDVVWGNIGQSRLYFNDGTGTFEDVTSARMPAGGDDTRAVALGDVDGDGDPDLVLGNSGFRQNRLYLNDGTGTFTDATASRLPAILDDTRALALVDVDADGDLDLLVANIPNNQGLFGQNRLYVNDGTGTFTDVTGLRLPTDADFSMALAVGDMDGDGDPDLLVGNGGQDRLYVNSGAGTFFDVTAGRLPIDMTVTSGVSLGDVDGDGDLDAVLGNGGNGQQNLLYLNDGTGTFTDATAGRIPPGADRTSAIVLGDLDGDGDLDLVAGNGVTHQAEQNRVYCNDGTGTFVDATTTRMPADNDWTGAAAFADVDGDGDLDLLLGNTGQRNRFYSNTGGGIFVDATAGPVPTDNDTARAVLPMDVDGDGDADMVVANAGAQNRIWLNDGAGTFTDGTAGRMPPEMERTEAVAAGDVDGDGDLDLVLANAPFPIVLPGQNRLYRNDGSGVFTDVTATSMPVLADRSEAVALGDVDGDGDLDMVFGNTFSPNRLHLNDGTGVFSNAAPGRLPNAGDSTGVAMGDVDADGDLDLVFANFGQANSLLLNDGTGTFTASPARMPAIANWTRAVALADVDGDGDPDLVFANGQRGPSTDPQDRLYLNDGTGTFTDVTATRMPADVEVALSVLAEDVDADGDPDLLIGNGPSTTNTTGQNFLYVNDGSGTFTDATATRFPSDGDSTYGLGLADVDGDGDLDLWLGNVGPDRLYQNLLRHLDTPFLVAPGRRFRLDVHARYAPVGTTSFALPVLSFGLARIPLPPLGTIGIDPTAWFPLPLVGIPPASGTASLVAPFPDIPLLTGLSIHGQALVLQLPLAFLTNVTSDRIVR